MNKKLIAPLVKLCLASTLFLAASTPPLAAAPREFTASSPGANGAVTKIVLPYDEATKSGFEWDRLRKLLWYQQYTDPGGPAFRAADYLREGLLRMTGREPVVESGADLSSGIVLTTLALAPPEIKKDPAIIQALSNTGKDAYNANEAFFIRSEPKRVLVVANTPDGLSHGAVELLESVGYEVLGLGPNWIHVPDYKTKPLAFNIERAERPGYYIRSLWATSGQERGVGTLMQVSDPADEPVLDSYRRWRVGTRQFGQSMPNFPGHAMQSFHRAVLERMRDTNTTEGFLTDKTLLGLDAERPAATPENKGHLWINTDAKGEAGAGKVFVSDAAKWNDQNLHGIHAGLDLSVPLVRSTILEIIKERATTHFEKNPDQPFIIGTDPEDGGGYTRLKELLRYPNWYPDYLKAEGIPFGQPYVLHGFKELNQPRELWNPVAPSDIVFGFNNWLLREFDQWIDSLPAAQRVTASGKNKKEQVRASLYSYNYHDVPPNFNLDPRIRVMIASYPKHRGWDKWKNFKTQTDMAQAFQVMLPREPSGDYWIISLAYFRDYTANGIHGSRLPQTIAPRIHDGYRAGFRALSVETDFNFGKMGLEYYLYTRMLWNPALTVEQLSALRERCLQRAFGNGWKEMKEYYDFIAPENFKLNAPNNWAKAIRMIEAADKKIADTSPEQKRLDDLKQFWYFYYLVETGQASAKSREMKEFVWKGQMSYMTAMHMVAKRFFNTNNAKDAAGPEFNSGPAHYTHEETQQWWSKVLDHWKVTPVSEFGDLVLANGRKASSVDLNDLVVVQEFAGGTAPDIPFSYNAGSSRNEMPILTVARKAGEEIGFTLFWPHNPNNNFYRERDVFFGISRWNPQQKEWDELLDKTMNTVRSRLATDKAGKEFQIVQPRFAAPQPGTYRIEVVNGGDASRLTTLDYSLQSGEYSGARGHTYIGNLNGHTQSPVYFYIPKGTKSIDLEVWDTYGKKSLVLHNGLPTAGMKRTRTVEVSARGTHTVKLEPGEDGTLAMIQGNGFAFPYLYSAPMLWAKTPAALLVPREIATADGLTITP